MSIIVRWKLQLEIFSIFSAERKTSSPHKACSGTRQTPLPCYNSPPVPSRTRPLFSDLSTGQPTLFFPPRPIPAPMWIVHYATTSPTSQSATIPHLAYMSCSSSYQSQLSRNNTRNNTKHDCNPTIYTLVRLLSTRGFHSSHIIILTPPPLCI